MAAAFTSRSSRAEGLLRVGLGLPWAIVAACRFGGPSADPSAYIDFPSDASDTRQDGSDATEADAGEDAAPDDDGRSDASAAPDAAQSVGADAACMLPSSVAVCDPLKNTGCFLSQCDIDTSQTTPTGVCVLASPFPGDAGSPCTQTSGSAPCQPGATCYAGSCQGVCFCSTDCPSGQCCSGAAGSTGFGLCGACHP